MAETPKLIDSKGKRLDGRKASEMRPLSIEAGVLNRADGSAYLEWGNNKVMAAVYGPRECHPRHMSDPARALVRVTYNMASFSVGDRKRPGPDRRSTEISKVTSEAFSSVVFLEQFPRSSIDVFVEILQADAGTRVAALTAVAVALADAGIPMKSLLAGVAFGKIGGTVVLDLGKDEDNYGEADVPLAIIPRTEEIVLLQMDGDLTAKEFQKGMKMAIAAAKEIYEVQKDALKRRYAVSVEELEAEEGAEEELEEETVKEEA